MLPKMGEEAPPEDTSSPPPPSWQRYISSELPRTVKYSAHSAIESARSIQHSSSTHLRTLKDLIPQVGNWYRSYEEAFFHKVKDELVSLNEHPLLVGGVAVTAFLLLMRGPRRFLFRNTLGRFQSEEVQFIRAEKNVKQLSLSVDLLKKESKKLLERSVLAEKDMNRGHSNLMNTGTQIQTFGRSVYKAEAKAADLMDLLREIPGRDALKLRADVASMASHLQQQRVGMDKRIIKISELGVPV